MKGADGVPYGWFLDIFEHNVDVEETNFWFTGEPEGDMHDLGSLPEYISCHRDDYPIDAYA